jgi:PadR family transcriptional regulator AphA
MVKVFFADAGSRDQLLVTLARIEDEATGRLAALRDMATTYPPPFPQRAHLSAIGLRLQSAQEEAVLRWGRWAKEQVAEWKTAADPGAWDARDVLAELAGSTMTGTRRREPA